MLDKINRDIIKPDYANSPSINPITSLNKCVEEYAIKL